MSKVRTRICGQVEGDGWKITPRPKVIEDAAPPEPSKAPTVEVIPPAVPHPECEGVRPPVAHLPGVAAQLIGERMRTMYGRLVDEPVPYTLLDLVRQLESKERSE